MDFRVTPARLRDATVAVPGDKSISHRALMLGSIAEGRTEVRGFLDGADCLATAAAMRAMGVAIEHSSPTEIAIEGAGLRGLVPPPGELDLGNSGTAMRLMAGLAAGQAFDTVLTGDASLSGRPMERVITPLTRMGAVIESDCDGTPPLQIRGGMKLRGIHYDLPMASAQVNQQLLPSAHFLPIDLPNVEKILREHHVNIRMERPGGVLHPKERLGVNTEPPPEALPLWTEAVGAIHRSERMVATGEGFPLQLYFE